VKSFPRSDRPARYSLLGSPGEILNGAPASLILRAWRVCIPKVTPRHVTDDDQNRSTPTHDGSFRQGFAALGSRSLIWLSILGGVQLAVRVSTERPSDSVAIRRWISRYPRPVRVSMYWDDRHRLRAPFGDRPLPTLMLLSNSTTVSSGQRSAVFPRGVTMLPWRSTRIRRTWKAAGGAGLWDLASTAAVPIENKFTVRTLSSNVPNRTRSAGWSTYSRRCG